MLRETIDIVSLMQEVKHGFKFNYENWQRGIQQGQLPHQDDAMRLMNSAWDEI